MKKIMKKFLSVFLTINIITTTLPVALFATSATRPSYSVSNPSAGYVNVGGTVSYSVYYNNATNIELNASHVILNGFSANVRVSTSGTAKIITLSNIQGQAGYKSIGITAGSASNNGVMASGVSNANAFYLNVPYVDNVRPSISIGAPSKSSIYAGESVTYTVSFGDNVKVTSVNMAASYIVLNGFSANISVSGTGDTRYVTLSNIQGSLGNKSISIKSAAAVDSAGNQTGATPSSIAFNIIARPETPKPETPKPQTSVKTNRNNIPINSSKSTNNASIDTPSIATTTISQAIGFKKSSPVIKSGCEDNVEALGDINKEIKTFSAWLKSEKANAKYVIQNSYVSEGEETTYYAEYYNGTKSTVASASLSLTIPKGTDVLEINGDGYISDQTDSKTIIGWKLSNIASGAKCRVYAKVKYITDTKLKDSDNISEVFYPSLKVSVNGETHYSYLKQLFIDKNETKTGIIRRYLTSLNNVENIRPEEEITRAELAKMIADAGIIDESSSKDEYKEYKDAKDIPAYAKDAISVLTKLNIMEGYENGNFEPSNPILKDDMLKVLAKALGHMTDGKVKNAEATFIYSKILKNENEEISEQKDYIMELIRQNIIANEDVKSGEYALRKDAVEVINNLTFRGPYVESLPEDTIKFKDVSKDSAYFYNIVGATNSYKYTYTSDLMQKIIGIEK